MNIISNVTKFNTVEVEPGIFIHKDFLDEKIDFKVRPGDKVTSYSNDIYTVVYLIVKPRPGTIGYTSTYVGLDSANDGKANKQLHENHVTLYTGDTINSIKQAYLKDKAIAIKNGHKISNELDDFLMWCNANKITIQSYMKEIIPGKITLTMDSNHANIYFTIPESILPSKEEYQTNKQQSINKIIDFIRAKGDTAVSYNFYKDDYQGTIYLGDLREMNTSIEEFLDNRYKGE